jgi:hypothetical protein
MLGALSDERTGCHLQQLLALANAVILGFEPRGTREHTVSGSKLPFSSPPMTRMATVEVFDPTSTRDYVFILTMN